MRRAARFFGLEARGMQKPEKIQVGVKVERVVWAGAKAQAKAQGVTLQEWVERALVHELARARAREREERSASCGA